MYLPTGRIIYSAGHSLPTPAPEDEQIAVFRTLWQFLTVLCFAVSMTLAFALSLTTADPSTK